MFSEDSESLNVLNDSKEATGNSFSSVLGDKITFPRRRKCHARLTATSINWGELLAKATEEDKRFEATHPSIHAISEEESDSENLDPSSPLNLSAPRQSMHRNENALDLSSISKSLESHGSCKNYTVPTYVPQYVVQNKLRRTPLKESKQNTPFPTEKFGARGNEVVAKKSLFNPTDYMYEKEVVTQKQMVLDMQPCVPLRDGVVEHKVPPNGWYNQSKSTLQTPNMFAPSLNSRGCYKAVSAENVHSYPIETSNHPEQAILLQHPHENVFAIPGGPAPRVKPTPKELVINGKSYQVLALLGKGGSSKVQLVLAKDNSLLAVKCVNLANVDERSKADYLNEIEHLMKMQHCRHIIRIIDHQYIPSRNLLYAVMERGDTDLSRLLKERTTCGEGIPPGMILFYWSEMLLAVKSIHDNNIIHRDLKPANFLLVQGRLKLIDFGIASSIQNEQTSVFKDSQSGTPNYMSPEAWEDLGIGDQRVVKIGRKTDVWSLGCILYTFLYGKTPYQEFTNQVAKFRAITNPHHVIKFPPVPGVPKMLIESCRRCLVYDKDKRATIEELLALTNQMLMTPVEVIGKLRRVLDPESFQKATTAILEDESPTDLPPQD